MFDRVTDYETGGPDKLAFIRYYNSQSAAATIARRLGVRWRSNFDRYLTMNSASSVTAEREDGQQIRFTLTAGRWTPDSDVDLQLSVANGTWSLTNSDDSVEIYTSFFSGAAPLQSMRARNGYTQTLRYASSGELQSVSDSYNRTLSFAYSANGLLQSLMTPDNLLVTYAYTASGQNTANPATLDRLRSVGYSTTPPTSQTYGHTNPALPFAITQITDENGATYASWTYDRQARALSSEFAGGTDKTVVTYNDNDGSRSVTNALGQQLIYRFTTLQGTPKVTQTDRVATPTTAAATRRFTYDSNGYTASETDWNGNLTTYVNNSRGLPASVTEASGTPQARTTTITYHPVFHLPLSVTRPGLTTTFTYDSSGNLLTRTQTDTTTGAVPYSTRGATRRWTYTWANGLLTSIQGPRADGTELTKLSYDSLGFLSSITNAAGHVTRITNSRGGLPQAIVDANRVSTVLTYDQRLRLTSRTITTAQGPLATRFGYDAVGNLLTRQSPDGSAVSNTYDAARRLREITDVFGERVRMTLDLAGNPGLVEALDANAVSQRTQRAAFDALGRRLSSTRGEGQNLSFTYDANGNVLTMTDPLGRLTRQTFDSLNRLTRITDAAGGITAITYDAEDRPLTLTDPNGAVTTYTYNGFGDLIQRVSPDTGTTIYRYDASANLSQMLDGRGVVANYTYDALNRITGISYPANSAENVRFTYDEEGYGFSVGRLTTVVDAAGTLHRTYDERGNVLTETRAGTKTSFAYDAAGRISSMTYPSAWQINYTRDKMGRITGIGAKAPAGETTQTVLRDVSYLPFGPVREMTFGNDVVQTRTFDADYRTIKIEDQGSSTIQSLAYEYDAANNVLGLKDGVTPVNDQVFVYDPLDRLTQATGGYGALGYGYDSVGNRLTETRNEEAARNYTYSPKSNRLTSILSAGTVNVSYTGSGNIGAFVQGESALRFDYNQANRLASASEDNRTVLQYTYDAFGRRLAKTGAAVSRQQYRYDLSGHLLEEINSQGEAAVDYVYLGDQPVALIEIASGNLFYLHTDRLGTPQRATSNSQEISWRADYLPFGELNGATSQTASPIQSLRFPGQEAEIETGFYQNGFRDYLPGLGRYLQSDPIGLAGGVNTYAYVDGRPLRAIDRVGLRYVDPMVAIADRVAGIGGQCVEGPCSLSSPTIFTPEEKVAIAQNLTLLSRQTETIANGTVLYPPAAIFFATISTCTGAAAQVFDPNVGSALVGASTAFGADFLRLNGFYGQFASELIGILPPPPDLSGAYLQGKVGIPLP